MPKAAKGEDNTVKLLVLDVLKPHQPNIVEFGKAIKKANGIENLDVTVYAIDEKTESVKVVLEGDDLQFDVIRKTVEDFGAVVHSVDKVSVGKDFVKYHMRDLPHYFRHV